MISYLKLLKYVKATSLEMFVKSRRFGYSEELFPSLIFNVFVGRKLLHQFKLLSYCDGRVESGIKGNLQRYILFTLIFRSKMGGTYFTFIYESLISEEAIRRKRSIDPQHVELIYRISLLTMTFGCIFFMFHQGILAMIRVLQLCKEA